MRFNRKKTSIIALLFVASLLVVLAVPMVKAQTSTTTVTVTPQSSTPVVGQTFTINIQLNDVQNLYALDVTLDYNSLILQLVNSKVDLGTSSIPGGVLYGSPVTDDENNIASGAVYYNTSLSTSSEYHLFATSVDPASAFSGSGTIATLTFKVTNAGDSNLTLASTLANYAPGGTSEPIANTDVSGTVDATLSSSPTPLSSSPSPTPTIPEFPLIATLSIVVLLASVAIVLAVKKAIKPESINNFLNFRPIFYA